MVAFLPFIDGYWPKLACFVIFVSAAVTDVIDGQIARYRGWSHRSRQDPRPAGRQAAAACHPRADLVDHQQRQSAYGIPVWGSIPLWVCLLLIGREFAMTLLRAWAGRKGVVIPASSSGKIKASLQNVFIGGTLAWFAFRDAFKPIGVEGTRVRPLVDRVPRPLRRRHAGDRPHPDPLVVRRLCGEVPPAVALTPVSRALEMVTVGTELLLGDTVDTNAAHAGRLLARHGLRIARRATVADSIADIQDAVGQALARSGQVIVTGGLGPTRDDMTRAAVAELLEMPLEFDQGVWDELVGRWQKLGRTISDSNRSQAMVPRGGTVLPNRRGSAPGLWLDSPRGLVVLLPGVPLELEGLLAEQVLPRLAERLGLLAIRSRVLRTAGVPESKLGDLLGPLEESLAPVTLAYLPDQMGVDLRLTVWEVGDDDADTALDSRRGGDP